MNLNFTKKIKIILIRKYYFYLPVNEIVANVLRSKGGAHQRHIPCAAG